MGGGGGGGVGGGGGGGGGWGVDPGLGHGVHMRLWILLTGRREFTYSSSRKTRGGRRVR